MKRNKLNFLIDAAAFFGFVMLTTTGILMRYILPPGSGHFTTIWGLDRHEWGGIHFWVSILFFSLLALHLVLHWRWIVSVVTGRSREASGLRAGLGLVGLVAVIALSMAPLLTPIEKNYSGNKASPLSAHQHEGISIRGSMTLREVEQATEVPVDYMITSLMLPASISPDARLGPMSKKYGFSMYAVREIIAEYNNRKLPAK